MDIRAAQLEDAEGLLALQLSLDRETTFMMLEPGERSLDVGDLRARIAQLLVSPNSTLLLAEIDGAPVGFIEAEGGEYRRTRHVAHLALGVLAAYRRRGVGTSLLETMDDWARSHGVRRLELSVMSDNEPAIALYRKAGYQVEGTRSGSILREGRFVDGLAMAKFLA